MEVLIMDKNEKWMLSLPNNEYWSVEKYFDTKNEAIEYARDLIDDYRKLKDHSGFFMIEDIIAGSDSSMPASAFKELVVGKIRLEKLMFNPYEIMDSKADQLDEEYGETVESACEDLYEIQKDKGAMYRLQKMLNEWQANEGLNHSWFIIIEEDTFITYEGEN